MKDKKEVPAPEKSGAVPLAQDRRTMEEAGMSKTGWADAGGRWEDEAVIGSPVPPLEPAFRPPPYLPRGWARPP